MTRRKNKHSRTRSPSAGDMIYGTHAVAAALANPRRVCLHLWLTANAASRLSPELQTAAAQVEIVRPEALDRRLEAGAVHQGILLEAVPLEDPVIEDLPGDGLVVILDQVTDPHNIGAILRSCAAFGVRALVLTDRHAPAATGVLAKAASGALEHVPIVRVGNLARALKEIAASGYEIIGFDSEAATDIRDLTPSAATALVFGAEGKGLRRLTRENCDVLARIDTPGQLASLNVSNATAIALYACAPGTSGARTPQ